MVDVPVLLSYLFFRHKYHKIVNYFDFELVKKKIWANLQRITELSTENCHYALKNMGLGSGTRKNPIPNPGSRGQKGTRSATLRRTTTQQLLTLMTKIRGSRKLRNLRFLIL
jgi:hypothetical protein